MLRQILFTTIALSFSGSATELKPKPLPEKQIRQIMHELQVPGAAIGVIHQGKVIHARGFGVKTLGQAEPIDGNSIFKIASNTKAFTTAALAILVDEGKLDWQGKVQSYLPDFKMYDPWVSEHFTVIDLLTHRSGLGLGAGDLMLWPEPSSFSRAEVTHNLRYLKPTGEFRADYAYDNLLYIVAGELIPAVTGQSWEDFVQQRIMQPLGMQHCFAGPVSQARAADVATPHGVIEGKLQAFAPKNDASRPSVSAAAGGIQCSLNDMLKWVKVQLDSGTYQGDQNLFSEQQQKIMWQAHTIMPLSMRSQRIDNSHISAYGLGWRMNDMDGQWQVHHTGSLNGMYSFVSLFPELELGFVVLTNQQSSAARSALMYSVMKPYLGDDSTDWLAEFSPKKSISEKVKAIQEPQAELLSAKQADNQAMLGKYDDPWLGRFIISAEGEQLRIHSLRVSQFVGSLYQHSEPDSALIRWDERSLEADAIIYFKRDAQGKISGMTMKPASEDIDFSYDFQDLDFTKLAD